MCKPKAWVIVKDHIDTDRKGLAFIMTGRPRPKREDFVVAFRLYDDDRNLYYECKATDEETMVDALDWAMYDVGCTILTDEHGEDIIS